jgi:hypothetical protein
MERTKTQANVEARRRPCYSAIEMKQDRKLYETIAHHVLLSEAIGDATGAGLEWLCRDVSPRINWSMKDFHRKLSATKSLDRLVPNYPRVLGKMWTPQDASEVLKILDALFCLCPSVPVAVELRDKCILRVGGSR